MPLMPCPRSVRTLGTALVAGMTVFCAPASPQTPAPVPGSDGPRENTACIVRADSSSSVGGDTVRIALFDSVSRASAPDGENDAERLVFRQIYEPLVRLDCQGNLVGAAARSWQTTDSGKSWTFELRDSLRYSDGSPYEAREFPGRPSPMAGADPYPIESVEAVSSHSVRVVLARAASTPKLFTDPAYNPGAVRAESSGDGWHLGTGPYRPDQNAPAGVLRLLAVDTAVRLPVLEFRQAGRSDSRDVLDHGTDLMVTADPRLLDYADGRGRFGSLSLPWSKTYLLVVAPPVSQLPLALAPLADSLKGSEMRGALARDAVRAESRAAPGMAVTQDNVSDALVSWARGNGSILYPPGDRTAQDLAERLVALVAPQLRWRAAPMGDNGHSSRTSFVGMVVSRSSADPDWPVGLNLPLVETRAHAILRRGSPAWVVDGDGTLRMPLPGAVPP